MPRLRKILFKVLVRSVTLSVLVTSLYVTGLKPTHAMTVLGHNLLDSNFEENYEAGENANHIIGFTVDGGGQGTTLEAGDVISVDYPAGFVSDGGFVPTDFYIEYQPMFDQSSYQMSVIDVQNGQSASCNGAQTTSDVAVTVGSGPAPSFDIELCPTFSQQGATETHIVINLLFYGLAPGGELTNPSTAGDHTVTYTYTPQAGPVESSSSDLTITGSGASAPGIEQNPTGYTTLNRPQLDRLKAGLDSIEFSLSFALDEASGPSDTLSIVFPTGFANVDASGASATCSGGGTISNWQDDDDLNAWADKANCAGTVSVEGIYVDLPDTPGSYIVQWSNDNGSGAVAIVDDDQVSVTSQVDPFLVFDIDTSTNTSADTSTPYRVDFGTLTSSQTNVSGEASINYIMIDLSTNASSGAVVTIRNENGTQGLVSASATGDSIQNVAGSMSTGTENYGFCVQSVSQSLGSSLEKSGAYTTGTCADQADGNYVQALSTSDAPILSVSGSVDEGRAIISGSAAAGILSEAHDDYADTLTLIATATY